MTKLTTSYLIVTHISYRKGVAVRGPFSSVGAALPSSNTHIISLPLDGFESPVTYGSFANPRALNFPKLLGTALIVKYIVDLATITLLTLKWLLFDTKGTSKIVLGIDPLSTLPLIVLKQFFGFKLVFYCVDFNETRFQNPLMQKIYELTDEWSSKYSDQVWVVSEYLMDYKKKKYGVTCIYIPNSYLFGETYYKKNKTNRTGTKLVWQGSILTDKQITDILKLCKAIYKLRPDMEFWFTPSSKAKGVLFEEGIKYLRLKNARVFDIIGQQAMSELVSQCDIGLAVYNKDFGSTKYIEPIKVWDYMLCGLPFIISCETSVSSHIKNAGVVLFLEPDNQLPNKEKLIQFIDAKNLTVLQEKALKLAKRFDQRKIIPETLSLL